MALLQRVRTGTALLFGHQLAELGFIHLHALVGGHFERDFNREAVSVMQLEGILAGHEIRAALPGLRHGHVEDLGAGFERAAERVLLTVGGFGHVVEGVVKLRIARFHRGLGGRQQGRHDRLCHAELAHGLDGSTQQAAQHIATAVVGRTDAVGHDHQRGTHVVGHDTETHVHGLVIAVGAAGKLLRGFDDREDLVGLIDVLLALHQIGETFQTGAGIDVLVLKLADDMQVGLGLDVVDLVVFEHEIPNLNVTVLVGDRAAFDTVLWTTVYIDFGARTARARATGGPEVIFHTHDLDMFRIDAFVLPHRAGFLVVGESGHPQFLRIEAVAALILRGGQQLIRIVDGLLLEVITEGEVAKHLEERAVTGGLADLVDVQSTHALLVGSHAVLRRGLLTHEVRDERNHASDGEQSGRIRRNQRCRRNDKMIVLFEIVKKALRDFRSAHVDLSSFVVGGLMPSKRVIGCLSVSVGRKTTTRSAPHICC